MKRGTAPPAYCHRNGAALGVFESRKVIQMLTVSVGGSGGLLALPACVGLPDSACSTHNGDPSVASLAALYSEFGAFSRRNS